MTVAALTEAAQAWNLDDEVVEQVARQAVGVELEDRILDAALVLVARWGVGKTSLSDVAKEAGCSRATVYRAFSGGRQQVLDALAARELGSYLESITVAIDSAETLEEAVTRGLVVAARSLGDHEAAQFVLAHEPEILTPFLGFKMVDRLYGHVSAVIGPHLERLVPADRAAWLAEWAARAFVSYLFNPATDTDLTVVAQARRLVSSFVIPAFDDPAPTLDLTDTASLEVGAEVCFAATRSPEHSSELQPIHQPSPNGSTHVHH